MQRNKTDKLDAALIADFCRTQQAAAWTPPAPEIRQLVRHLDDLTRARQQARNHVADTPLAQGLGEHWHAQISLLEAQIAQTQRAISALLNQHPDLKRQADLLRTIQGLGDTTIGKLLAECRDIRAFRDVRQLVAFVGLKPRHHVSSSSIHKRPTISRTGSTSLRAALFMPALTAMRFNPLLRAWSGWQSCRGGRHAEALAFGLWCP
jgi:transposase